MSTLSLTKVSEGMTAKERVKMVIALQFKNMNAIPKEDWERFQRGDDTDFEMPGQAEVRMLVAGCPSEQAREYNFLIGVKDHIWEGVLEQMRDDVNFLSIIEGKMAVVKCMMNFAPFFQTAMQELRRVPKMVGKEEYDQAVIVTREMERQAELSMEGRYNLAEQEAYYRLIKEGKIEDGGDLDGYLDYIADFGRTKQELIDEKIGEIKKGLKEYQARKERMGGEEEPLLNFYSKYEGLNNDQIKEKVVANYFLEVPSDEEHQRWIEAVKQEKNRLQEAVKTRDLVAKGDGVLAGSYYDWRGRYQKFAGEEESKERGWNPLHENCMEIGYSGGKVVSAVQAGNDWRQIVAVTIHNKESMRFGCEDAGEKRIESVAEMLGKFNPFEMDDRDYKNKEVVFRISNESYKNVLGTAVAKAKETIQDIYNNLALIEAVEDKYFDGMEILNREPGKPFSIGTYLGQVKQFADGHNEDLKKIGITFSRMNSGFWEYKFEGIDDYLLPLKYKADVDWVSKNLDIAERGCKG